MKLNFLRFNLYGPATVSYVEQNVLLLQFHVEDVILHLKLIKEQMISATASDYGVDEDKTVDPEAVADQLDDIVGTFYTYTLPAALVPMKMQKGGE